MPQITIDKVGVSVAEGTTILQAAAQAGIYIPHLCLHPELPPVDCLKPADVIFRMGQRMENARPELRYEGCQLCVVELEGQEGLHCSCCKAVAEGMIIRTTSPAITSFRRDRIMELVSRHPHACLQCAQKDGCARFPCSLNIPETERCCSRFANCEFRRIVEYIGLNPQTPRYVFADLPLVSDNPFFELNFNLCIGCTRCIRMCRDICGIGALDFIYDDQGRIVVGTTNKTLEEASCCFCLSCVEVCPTGALREKETSKTKAFRKDDLPADSDLSRRLGFQKPILHPGQQKLISCTGENISMVPEAGGVYQLFDGKRNVIYIKGTMNLKKELREQLALNKQVRFFVYEENPLYSKRESELLQLYLANYGKMPDLNRELDDLF